MGRAVFWGGIDRAGRHFLEGKIWSLRRGLFLPRKDGAGRLWKNLLKKKKENAGERNFSRAL